MAEEPNIRKPSFISRERGLFLGAMGVVLALIAVAVAATIHYAKGHKPAGPVAPGFALRDQNGRLTSLAQFRGKVVLLAFVDPVCTQLCPLTTESMVEAMKMLGPEAASQVQMLGIDVNPEKTTVADVAAYTRVHGLEGRWRFLTGSVAQLKKVWQEYHVYVTTQNGAVGHEAVVYLIGRHGEERDAYSTPMSYEFVGDLAETFAEGIAPLLPGHSASASPDKPPTPMPKSIAPSDAVRLAALGAKRPAVVVGGVHPHLVVFFAGWLRETSNLRKDLATLDRYGAEARRRDWPSPVAVDELTTEPSPAEARQMLLPIAAKLHTPIVEDAKGRLADGYVVQDLPWFALSSRSGKILWHHDGWLPPAALKRDVALALAKR